MRILGFMDLPEFFPHVQKENEQNHFTGDVKEFFEKLPNIKKCPPGGPLLQNVVYFVEQVQ